MNPKTIAPQDIRVGDRICIAWSMDGVDHTATLSVHGIDNDGDPTTADGGYVITDRRGVPVTITLLSRPEPAREVGSHWRDPETGAEYVLTDAELYDRYRRGDGYDSNRLIPGYDREDNAAIARLVPVGDPNA